MSYTWALLIQELCCRYSYGTFAGYFGNEEATTSTLDSDGWLRTGDLCYIDDDGFLFVIDRLKELIKYKGYQVHLPFMFFMHPSPVTFFESILIWFIYLTFMFFWVYFCFLCLIYYSFLNDCREVPPAELEALLLSHPEITDAAVIP